MERVFSVDDIPWADLKGLLRSYREAMMHGPLRALLGKNGNPAQAQR